LRRFGLVIDRGRLVREAIAVLLADLDTRGKDSLLARRIGTSAASHPHSGEEAVTDGTVLADGPVLSDGTAPGGTGEPIPSLM
jgi:hypothetical protein